MVFTHSPLSFVISSQTSSDWRCPPLDPEALHHHVGRRTTTVVVGYHVLLLLQESVARWLRQLQPLQPPQHHQLQPLHADDNGGRNGSPQVAVLVSDNWCVTDDYKCRVPGKSR